MFHLNLFAKGKQGPSSKASFWKSNYQCLMLPGNHFGSIQRLGLSDDTDCLFRVVEVIQIDSDDAAPLLCVLVSHHSFFVSIRNS